MVNRSRLAGSVHLTGKTSIKMHTNEGNVGKSSPNMDINIISASIDGYLLESYGYIRGKFVEWQLG